MAHVIQIESLVENAGDSERAILGLLLLEPDRFRQIDLAVNDFGAGNHRELFAAMKKLDADSESWDLLSLVGHLRNTGRLEAAGGAAFVSDLTTGVPRNLAIFSHVRRVREASARRRAAKAFQDGLDRVQDATVSPHSLISETLGDLEHLASGFDREGNILPYAVDKVGGERRPELLCLADVRAASVDWLWEPYLPLGMLAMLSGDPGCGKTYLALAIAAALSNGVRPYTQNLCAPVSTLYLSLENSPEHVVRPRFDALGGDPRRFVFLAGGISPKGKQQQRSVISLKDTRLIGDALAQTNAGLLVVDPIQSYLGADVDAHRSNETRPVLDNLARVAKDHNCCILLVRHLSKGSGGRAIHRGLGSIDLTGAVRTELMAGTEADNAESRALVQVKSNLGKFGDSLGYSIGEDGFKWTGRSTLTSSDLIAPDGDGKGRSEIAGAENYLREALGQGPMLQRNLVASCGYSERTLQRAAERIGVKRERMGERGSVIWKLPEAYPTPNVQPDTSQGCRLCQ